MEIDKSKSNDMGIDKTFEGRSDDTTKKALMRLLNLANSDKGAAK